MVDFPSEAWVLETKFFARKASGLSRVIGTWGVTMIAFTVISLAPASLIIWTMTPFLWPGVDMLIFITVSAILSMLVAFTYSQIGTAFPRSGADYVLTSRTISPALSSALSLTYVVQGGLLLGAVISMVPGFFSTTLRVLGGVYNEPSYLEWSDTILTPAWLFGIIVLFILLTGIVNFLSTSKIIKVFSIGFVWQILAFLSVMIVLYSSSPDAMVAAWNRFYGSLMPFQQVIPTATAEGFFVGPAMLMTFSSLVFGFWLYHGYHVSTYAGAEVRTPSKSFLVGMWGGILMIWFWFVVAYFGLYHVVSPQWHAALVYLFYATGRANLIPYFPVYATILNPNPALVIFIWAGFLAGWVVTIFGWYFFLPRIMFAMSFDRILPESIAYVHPKYRSPVVAIVIIMILSIIGGYIAIYQTAAFGNINFSFVVSLIVCIHAFAAAIFPFRRKDIWEKSPRIVRAKIGSIPVMTIAAVGSFLYLLWNWLMVILVPAQGGLITAYTIALVVGNLVIGAAIYYIARWYRTRREGIDISLAFREVPPL